MCKAVYYSTLLMSSTITIPTSVTCMENVKIASLGQNHFFRSVLNSHLLLQLIYFKLFYFCHIWFKFVFTHNPLWVWSFSQIINFEFTDTVKSRNNNILYYMEASISSVRSTGTLKTDSFRHGDEKMKAKMAEQTADFTALLVAFVSRLRSQYGVNMVKLGNDKRNLWALKCNRFRNPTLPCLKYSGEGEGKLMKNIIA